MLSLKFNVIETPLSVKSIKSFDDISVSEPAEPIDEEYVSP